MTILVLLFVCVKDGCLKDNVVHIAGGLTISDIQELLGHAVNGLIKHYYKPEKEVKIIPNKLWHVLVSLHKLQVNY